MKARFFQLFILTLLITSCGVLKHTIVENIDSLLSGRISDALYLYYKQEDSMDSDVTSFFNSNKELIQSIVLIIKKVDINKNSSNEIIQLREKYFEVANKISQGLLIPWVLKLDKKQQDYFLKEQKKKLNKISDNRENRAYKMAEFLLGDLTKDQKKIIDEYKYSFLKSSKNYKKRKLKFLNNLKISFEQNKKEEIKNIFDNYNKPRPVPKEILELVEKIRVSLNKTQQKHFKEKISEILDLMNHAYKYKY